MLKRARGFTLVELVVAVILLGVVAAVALPRLMDAGQDARISVIKSAHGAVASAAHLAMLKCQLVRGCYVAGRSGPITNPSGVVGGMQHGYPTGQTRLPNYFGINDWVQVQGLGMVVLGPTTLEFRVDSAPNPLNCKVVYREAFVFGEGPLITSVTSGC